MQNQSSGYKILRIIRSQLREMYYLQLRSRLSLWYGYTEPAIILGGAVPVFRRAQLFPTRIALQDEFGIYTYAGLYQAASVLSSEISAQLGKLSHIGSHNLNLTHIIYQSCKL